MTTSAERIMRLSPKRLALLALELEERLAAVESGSDLPIAVIGIGCRFPGAVDGPDAFWTLLCEGRDAIGTVPADRWPIDEFYDPNPDACGRMSTRAGGFLDDIRGFDAELFGISPREAAVMDPQQRLMLEVTWEALEHAGISPESLRGTATGVFAGVCNADYYSRIAGSDAARGDAYVATGNASSVISGRVSYTLGLQGPSITVDTACSSSLVAVHLACQSLRLGESRLALAGGVNVICSPETTVLLSKAHMMAPDGRCKTFDARANGFVRGEGCGIVALKRLSDAVADRDRVLAVIRGSAVNQDGRSSGLTAPNGPSQEAVIRTALATARIPPSDVGYVEAHGTGTSLGDPIEIRALGAALGSDRTADRTLIVGSVKTNIGHLESAAGIAGLIKAVLAIQHRWIPPHLHFETPNPHIDWAAVPVTIPVVGCEWPGAFARRIAGVSSFGFSGTNAHVILEQAPEVEDAHHSADRPRHVFTLSARSDAALRQSLERVLRTIGAMPATSVADLCHSANVGRAAMTHRLATTAGGLDELRARLEARRRGEPDDQIFLGKRPDSGAPEVVFLFSGQGAQYVGMAKELYESCPPYRQALDRAAAALADELPIPLTEILFDTAATTLDDTVFTQPALFAVEYALASMWMAWGVRPARVVGHSLGEIAASCIAGALSLEDAARLVAARGRLMNDLPPGGAMAAFFCEERVLAAHLARRPDVAIAAINAPDEIVLSGDRAAIDDLRQVVAAMGIESRALRVANAFHSPRLDTLLDEFERTAARLTYAAPRVPLLSTVTGHELVPGEMSARYWRRHARDTVRFADAMRTLPDRPQVFLEVGPGTALSALGRRSASLSRAAWLASIRSGRGDWEQCLDSLAALWAAGVHVDWTAFDEAHERRRVSLPTYPFQHVPYWINAVPATAPRLASRHPAAISRTLTRLPTAVPIFEIELTPDRFEHEPVHRTNGTAFLAAAFVIDAAREAVHALTGQAPTCLADLEFVAPVRADSGAVTLQLVVKPETGGCLVEIYASPSGLERARFALCARIRESHADAQVSTASIDLARAMASATSECSGHAFLARLSSAGVDFGRTTEQIQHVWHRDGEALVLLELGHDVRHGWTGQMLDAVMIAPAAGVSASDMTPRVLARVGRITLSGPPVSTVWAHTTVTPPTADGRAIAEVRVTNANGIEVLRLRDIELAPAPTASAPASAPPAFYQVEWQEAAPLRPFTEREGSATALEQTFARLVREHAVERYNDLQTPLHALATRYARAALESIGAIDAPGDVTRTSAADARQRVVREQRRLYDHLVSWFDSRGTDFETDAAAPLALADLQRAFPEFDAELALLHRCGPRLAEVLRGDVRPLDLLFGDPALLRRLYQQSPFARCFNALAAEVVASHGNTHRPLRVLEIGAGTGATTAWVLPRLDPDRTEYVFSDVSPAFLTDAAETFAAYPFVDYRLFDVERSGTAQGLQAGAFDVVLAANALHAAADLGAAVRHARELVAPDGKLVLVEGTEPQRWVDLTFGLTDGWWRFAGRDRLRSYPLIDANAWRRLLTEEGFNETTIVPERSAAGGQVVITAGLHRQPLAVAEPRRTWMVVGDRSELSLAIADSLADRGDTCELVEQPDAITAAPAAAGAVAGVVLVAGVAAAPTPISAALTHCERLTEVLRAVATWPATSRPRVWVITEAAQAVEGVRGIRVDQAALWGIGPVAALELPESWGGIIDVDPQQAARANAGAVVAEISGEGGEDRVVLRAGKRLVPRLIARATPAADALDACSGSWLITGGLGAVGARTANWLARKGVGHLVLVGRGRSAMRASTTDPAATIRRDLVGDLRHRGVHVEVVETDVADGGAVAALMRRFGTEWPPLQGIVHAATVFSTQPLAELKRDGFAPVFSAKALGAWHLHQHAPSTLGHFVLFSSTASLIGGVGQAPYAAANAMLDALAHVRRAEQRPALSINWGLWSAMRGVPEDVRRQYAAIGFHEMEPDAALDAMSQAIGIGDTQSAVAAIDWPRLHAAFRMRRRMPFLELVKTAPPTTARGRLAPHGDLMERLRAADARLRLELALECVTSRIAAILRLPPSQVPPERGLFEMGMDSLMSIELKRLLEEDTGQPLPSTLTFNHPSALALSTFLVGKVGGDAGDDPASAPAPREPDADDLSEDALVSALTQQLEELS